MATARGPLRVYYLAFYASMAVYLPYFPSWLRNHGIEGISMSVLMALLPIMNVFGPPGFGFLADSLGLRGRLLRWAATGAAVAFMPLVVYTLAGQTLSYAVVFSTCLGFAFFRTPMSLMADVVALEQGPDFPRLRLWGSLGFMFAVPLVGHYLDLSLLWGLPLVMVALLCVSQVTTLRIPDQAALPKRELFGELRQLLTERGLMTFGMAAMLGQAAHVGYDIVLTMHLQDVGMSGSAIGWAWAIATASEIFVMAYAPRFLTHTNAGRLLLLSLVVQCLRWVLMTRLSDHGWLLAAQVLHAVSFGLRWVSSMQIISRLGQSIGALATVQGLHVTATSLGSVVGMFLAGRVYQASGGSAVFTLSAGLAALGAAFAASLVLSSGRGTVVGGARSEHA